MRASYLGLILWVLCFACSKDTSPGQVATAQPPLKVSVMTLEPVSSYATRREYSGSLVARRSSPLGFVRAGRVDSITVEEGDRVSGGQTLARLDTRALIQRRARIEASGKSARARLKEAQALPRQEAVRAARFQVRQAEEQLRLSLLKRERRRQLFEAGAIPREQLDEVASQTRTLGDALREARARLADLEAGNLAETIQVREASVDELDAELGSVRVDLEDSVLTAPYGGLVARRLIDEGTIVAAGQPVLELVESAALEAHIGVPYQQARLLRPGEERTLLLGHQKVPARVKSLLPEVAAQTRTVTVVLEVPDPSGFRPGQTARLEIREEVEAQGFWLPVGALVKGNRGLWSCFTVEEGKVQRQEVEVLYTDGDRALVRGTLAAGDRVIDEGAHRVVPGQEVELP